MAEVVEVNGHGPNTVFLGEFFHRLEEVTAGHHRSIAGVFQNAFDLLHWNHFNRHVQAGFEFLCDQHRGTDVLTGGAEAKVIRNLMERIDQLENQVENLTRNSTRELEPRAAAQNIKDKEIMEYLGENG